MQIMDQLIHISEQLFSLIQIYLSTLVYQEKTQFVGQSNFGDL
jgi:hypothetical protein